MNEITLKLDDTGKGAFVVEEADVRMAEMVIGISGNNLTVYHTEVSEELKGQGVAPRLLSAMVDYARAHNLKVIPLCSYVSVQFRRHADQYQDIWNHDWHNK